MTTVNLAPQVNPDKPAIDNKEPISISVTLSDISASLTASVDAGLLSQVKLDNLQQQLVVRTGTFSPEDTFTVTGSVGIYYTPVYKERLNYEQWKRQINKEFQELEVD